MTDDKKPEKRKFLDGTEVKIICADCGSPNLVVRTNSHNGGQFLGCPNYPDCKHSEPIPESMKMKLQGEPELWA